MQHEADTRSSRPVAYVLRKFPVLSETFVLNELLSLEARGVPLHIFSLQRPNDPRFHDDLPKLKARVSYLPDFTEMKKLLAHNRRLHRLTGKKYQGALAFALRSRKPGLLWRFLQAGYVASEARRLKVRHIHAQFANRPTSVANLASKMTGIPFSFTAHAMDIFKQKVNPKALAQKAEAARFVVTVSDYNKRYIEEVTNTPASKIVKIHNGINLERFSPSHGLEGQENGGDSTRPDEFRLLCVARLVEKKGLSVLIDACAKLRDRGVSFRCNIVGKGLLRPKLESQIRTLKLTQHVHLLGPKTQLEVRELYRSSDLYVLPCVVGADGNREGLPVSIVEALASGLPVITTPVTGIPEAVQDGYNGILVPEGDSERLADAMETAIRNSEVYESLRRNARPSVEVSFDQDRTMEELRELLEAA